MKKHNLFVKTYGVLIDIVLKIQFICYSIGMFRKFLKIFGVAAITAVIVLGLQIYNNFDLIKKRSLEITANKPSMVGDYLSARYAHRNNQMSDAYKYYLSALKKDPQNKELVKSTYLLMISMGNMADAVKFINKHYDEVELDEMTIALKSILALKSKDYISSYKYAVEGIEKIGKYKNNEVVLILLPSLKAISLAGQNKFQEALTVYDELDDKRLEQYVTFQKARIYSMMGKKDKAIELFDIVIKEGKTFNNMITAASFFSVQGMENKVAEIIADYNSSEPSIRLTEAMVKSNNAHYNTLESTVSGILLEQGAFVSVVGRIEDSVIYLRLSTYLAPEPDYIILLLTRLLESKKMHKEALELYSLIKNTSNYYNNSLMNSALALAKMEKVEESEKILREVVKNEDYFQEAYLRLGDILISDKQYKNAANAYSKVIEKIDADKSKPSWSVYYARGICYERTGDWESAENDFIKSLELSPREPSVLNYLAYSWLVKGENLKEAKRMLKIALKQRPRDAHIIDSYGWALYKNGDNKGAMSFIEKANLMLPHDSVTNDHLGDVYWAMNRKTEAIYQWERALDLNPEPKDKKRIQEKIHSIFKKKVSLIENYK